MKPPLVIGIGNPTRGDDGAGLQVVTALARLVPWAHYRVVHQLTPELAEDIAAAREVIFVDASVEAEVLLFFPLEPAPVSPESHVSSPGALLALAAQVSGCTPPLATAVAIPASSLAFSEELSLVTQRWVRVAISRLAAHLSGDGEDLSLLH